MADAWTALTGANLIVDMRKKGVSMMVNKFTIEATEISSTTTTATAQPSLSSNSLDYSLMLTKSAPLLQADI